MLVLRSLLLLLGLDLLLLLEEPFALRVAARLAMRDLNAGRQPTITAFRHIVISFRKDFGT